MAQVDQPIGWIDIHEPTQITWALGYLMKRGNYPWIVPTDDSNAKYELIKKYASNYRCDSKVADTLRKMRAAWNQKKHRDSRRKRGQKTHNFIMSKTTSKELQRLATLLGKPLNQTLQALISDSDATANAARKRLTKQQNQNTTKLERLEKQVTAPRQAVIGLLSALERATQLASLAEICLKDSGLEGATDGQKNRAFFRQEELLNNLLKDVKPWLDLMRVKPALKDSDEEADRLFATARPQQP